MGNRNFTICNGNHTRLTPNCPTRELAEFLLDQMCNTARDDGYLHVVEVASPPVTLESAVALGKRQIFFDIAAGFVPSTVKTFAELHDYRDANYYGGAFELGAPLPSDDFWNQVQDALDK